jgi:chemotaxis protein histidine kinase CheA
MDPFRSSSENLLDTAQLDSFISIGYTDYIDLLSDVIQDVTTNLASIQMAIQQGNLADLKARAHSLRGMLSYFGCLAMTDLLKILEESSSLTPLQAAEIHSQLGPLWTRSLSAIKTWEKSVPHFAPAG